MLLLPSMILVFTLQSASPAIAQSGKKADDVIQILRKDIAGYLARSVQPVMETWKSQFDASLRQIDLARLESLRKQAHELFDRISTNASEFTKARADKDFRRALDYRSKLESNFESRKRLLGEAQRVGKRSGPALELLQARVDSMKEEWKAGAIRIFIDWFARNQAVIRPILSDDSNKDLVAFMAAAKDLRLEETSDDAIFYFLLWDGSDLAPDVMAGRQPETPLSRTGPSREHSLLFEPCAPSTFSNATIVRFTLPVGGRTKIHVYDARGRGVTTLLDADLIVGKHSYTFNAERFPAGVYYFHLTCRDLSDVQVAQLSR